MFSETYPKRKFSIQISNNFKRDCIEMVKLRETECINLGIQVDLQQIMKNKRNTFFGKKNHEQKIELELV